MDPAAPTLNKGKRKADFDDYYGSQEKYIKRDWTAIYENTKKLLYAGSRSLALTSPKPSPLSSVMPPNGFGIAKDFAYRSSGKTILGGSSSNKQCKRSPATPKKPLTPRPDANAPPGSVTSPLPLTVLSAKKKIFSLFFMGSKAKTEQTGVRCLCSGPAGSSSCNFCDKKLCLACEMECRSCKKVFCTHCGNFKCVLESSKNWRELNNTLLTSHFYSYDDAEERFQCIECR